MNDFEWIDDIETLERVTDITQLNVGDRVKVTTMCDIKATDEYGYVRGFDAEHTFITFDERFSVYLHRGFGNTSDITGQSYFFTMNATIIYKIHE